MNLKISKILGALHTGAVSLAVTGAGLVEAVKHSEVLQAAIVSAGVSPKLMATAGLVVGGITHLIDKNGKDKLAQAIMNDPSLPTPKALGLPAPEQPEGR